MSRSHLLLAILAVLFICCPAWAETFSGKVVAVTDGDTIKVWHNGQPERIRLSEIDCPEKSQAFGNQAKQFTSSMVFGNEVTIDARGTDRYGRTIGEVILSDGTSVNRSLVEHGLAWWYRRYSHDQSLGQLENEARSQHLGLWQDPHAIPPWVYRKLEASSR